MTHLGFPGTCTRCRSSRSDRSDHVQALSALGTVSSSPTPECVPTSESLPALTLPSTSPNNSASNPSELFTDDRKCNIAVSTSRSSPSPTQEHIPASPSAPSDNPLSHMHELSTNDQRYVSATRTPYSSTKEHVPTSKSPPFPILPPADKLHPTLTCWIKNMENLSCLIDRLQELASSAPLENRFQLSNQVVALRAASKKQREHFMEFLQLSEEYANKYLLDVSAEIQQQSSFLDKLKERLETAERLRREAIDLQTFYESRTVATMESLRTTGKAAPCRPQKQSIETLISALSRIATASRGPCPVQRGGHVAY